ncbi:Basic helix-loop-helix DNA-binding superfamily protein [Tripterygium wilfordii]|uniref:Basic helix-loop-helix DNA-binding superfamily protein n=1 Tax=Tripterygium wilfordii TaxID=458696 RepID=A0A7J7DQH3_TRIWF|nr:transcription factor bHLH68-like [Tripterygium wilfordii]KAF5748567.1 Basic helix-loop-helix DNA-binding superfamily protein [Tripterygium wilfordii]
MNQGVLQQTSPVQQMNMAAAAAGGNPNLWSMRPPTPQTPPYNFAPPPPPTHPNLFPSSLLLPINPSWLDHHQQLPESWSQLLLGGGGAEEDKASLNHFQANHKKCLEIWEEDQDLLHKVSSGFVDVKQEIYGHANHHHHQDFQAMTKPSNWSPHQVVMPVSPPKSCVTTNFTSSATNNMLDFSSQKSDGCHPPPPDRSSSECNSTSATGGAAKKARVQPSSIQSPLKVRKEKLGNRITALHQLVSPFGKTDTASVLLEAIGYITFLQSQIEALSLPYWGSSSGNNNNNMRHHHQQQYSVQGERNCIFPEDPGQLLNDSCMKRKLGPDHEQDCINEEGKKDLRSRGLCLVPVSCTLQVGSDNGADYWAPAFGGGFR